VLKVKIEASLASLADTSAPSYK